MRVVIHVAVADGGVIGRDGGLPWRLSTDLRRFKAETMGKPVVMGRRTWDSFPKRPLPGRANVVVTRDPGWRADGALRAGSLRDALAVAAAAAAPGTDEVCVIGGGQIYREALALADELHVTHVLAAVDGDTRFPPIDPDSWEAVSVEDVPASERDSHATRHVVYRRRASG